MRKYGFTAQQEKYIKSNYLKLSSRSLAKKLDCSRFKVQRFLKRNGLKVPKEIVGKFRIDGMKGRTTFTGEETAFIKKNYLTMPVKTISKNINRSATGVLTRMRQLGLEIPKEIREGRKRKNQFPKGHVPYTKGKKQTEYMSRATIERTKATRFQKGHRPHNYRTGEFLTMQIEKDGTKHIVFTGSTILMDMIKQVPGDGFPFQTTIIRQGEHLELT